MNPTDLSLFLRCSTYAGALVLAVFAATAVLTCIARGAVQHTTFDEFEAEPDLSNEGVFSDESSTDGLSEEIETPTPEIEVIPEPTPSYANV